MACPVLLKEAVLTRLDIQNPGGSPFMNIKQLFFLLFLTLGFLFPFTGFTFVIDQILAVVNRDVITASDLRATEILHSKDSPLTKEELLEHLIDEALLVKEAERFEIKPPSEEEVLTALLKFKEKFSNEASFQDFLRKKGTTPEILKGGIQRQIWINRFLNQRVDFFVLVLPEEVTRYYESNPEEFGLREIDDEIQKVIEEKLIQQKAKKRRKEYISKLRAKAEIRVNQSFP
ncbi:MAG TPA: hypothetical protein VGB26_07425 [Nitrospiria bacterium]